jgi:DNA-binding beta-propeller fold protein YncE
VAAADGARLAAYSRLWLMAAFVLSSALPISCAPTLRPIFDRQEPGLTWPPPPKPSRIQYVGQLRTSEDLKPPSKPFEGLADLLVGRKEPDVLYGPRDVAVSRDGQRVWIADPGGRCLHLFDLQNRSYRKIERLGRSRLISPVGLCQGPGESMYVCDSQDVAIHRFLTLTGAWMGSLRLTEDIRRPAALHYDADNQELYVVDVSAHDIKVLGRDGRLLRIIGHRGTRPGEFNYPSAIAGSSDTLWVSDTGNSRVQAIRRSGEPIGVFGQSGDAPGDFALPKGIALDRDAHVYVVDARFENVQIFSPNGQLLLSFGQEGTAPGEFWLPGGIFIDSVDRIWICDSYNARVQVFQYVRTPATQPAGESE